mgnify:FL=1
MAVVQIQLRNDTAANWTSVNPTLLVGEFGVERSTNKIKIGDGSTAWSSLSYAYDPTVLVTLTGTQTLTNKTISGSSNTLSNIPNSALTNSSITINGSSVALGGTVTITGLPTQTGNSGKYLTTDGTNASWATITTDPNPQIFMLMGS